MISEISFIDGHDTAAAPRSPGTSSTSRLHADVMSRSRTPTLDATARKHLFFFAIFMKWLLYNDNQINFFYLSFSFYLENAKRRRSFYGQTTKTSADHCGIQ